MPTNCGYASMSDAINRYVEYQRANTLSINQLKSDLENAIGAALGAHFVVDVSIAWRKGKEEPCE